MKVVIDTNVFVSAVLSRHGPPYEVVSYWRRGHFELIISSPLLSELERVLSRPRIRLRVQDDDFLEALATDVYTEGTVVEATPQIQVVRDAADNRVLEAAVAGEADYIVSGNSDLLDLARYGSIEIVTPARFAAILAAENL